MSLEFAKRKALLTVMGSMFSTLEDFRTFLKDATGRNADEIAVGGLATVRSRVLDNADEREWLPELTEALKEIAGPQARAALEGIDISRQFAPPRIAALRTALTDVRERLGAAPAATTAELDAQLAARLLEVAKSARNDSSVTPELRRALEQLGLLAETPGGPALETIVRESNSLLDIHNWVARLTEIEGMVCRIAIDSSGTLVPRGTGFLVAPDIVLTNRHVIAPVLDGNYQPSQLRAQFDYHVLRNGTVDEGTLVKLADDWLLGSAQHDPIDTKVHPLSNEPDAGNLDFALLRLSRPAGAQTLAGGKPNGKPARGFLDLEAGATPADKNSPVFIVQHPEGGTMKLALDTAGVIGISKNQLRIRYRTNTLRGSSGSPVFNQDWELIALHHAGDPKYPELNTGQYNEGIPIRTLVEFFKNHDGLLKKIKGH
jgi:hypothetical protein